MRIAMIGSKGIPAANAQGGGIETHVEELSTRLVARGYDVTVYVRPYANPERVRQFNGINLVTLPTIQRKHLDTMTHTVLSTLHAMCTDAEILHFHGVGPSTAAWLPRIFTPWKKVIVTFHSRDRFHEKWRWFARKYLSIGEWTAVRFPHATIAVSHAIKLFCQRRLRAFVWYIPNGVDIPRVRRGSEWVRRNGLEPGKYLYTLCRLVPHKAVEDAIQAFTRVETDLKLVVIGDAAVGGERYEEMLHRLASKDPRIKMLGRRTGEELEQLMTHAYAMIHPSRSEGLSVAILEAMAHGKLVVMSDIPENLELVDHSGLSYPVGNVERLREALAWIVADPEIVAERGKRARDVVSRLYSWDTVVERTEALYASLTRV